MTRLVIRHDPALLVAHDPFLLEAGDEAIDRGFEIQPIDMRFVEACREQRRLVDQVGQIRAGEPGGALGDYLEVDVRPTFTPFT